MSTVAVPSYLPIEQMAEKYLPKNSRSVSSVSDQVTTFSDILKSFSSCSNLMLSIFKLDNCPYFNAILYALTQVKA